MVSETITIRSSYMSGALDPACIERAAVEALEGVVRFDTVIGTGLSGVLPLALLAERFNASYCAVRKPTEKSHSHVTMEGTIGRRWLFVDDFISSGETFNRVFEEVWRVSERREHVTECVGAFCYERPEGYRFESLAKVRREHSRVQQMYKRLTEPPPKPEPKPVSDPMLSAILDDSGYTFSYSAIPRGNPGPIQFYPVPASPMNPRRPWQRQP